MENCWLFEASKTSDLKMINDAHELMHKNMILRFKRFDDIMTKKNEFLSEEDMNYCNCMYCNNIFLTSLQVVLRKMICKD